MACWGANSTALSPSTADLITGVRVPHSGPFFDFVAGLSRAWVRWHSASLSRRAAPRSRAALSSVRRSRTCSRRSLICPPSVWTFLSALGERVIPGLHSGSPAHGYSISLWPPNVERSSKVWMRSALLQAVLQVRGPDRRGESAGPAGRVVGPKCALRKPASEEEEGRPP